MYRQLNPFGRLVKSLHPATELLPHQALRLSCKKQNLVIYRLAHNKRNTSHKKEKTGDLFDQLKLVKIESSFPKEKYPVRPKVELRDAKYVDFRNDFNVVRPEKRDNKGNVDDRLFEMKNPITEEERNARRQSLMILSSSITPELEKEIIGNTPNKKFMLKQALLEIERFECRRGYKFLFPKSLTAEQWKTLISLNDERSRTIYVHSLSFETGAPSLEEILEQDKVFSKPLEIDPAMIQEVVGDDTEAERRLKIFLMEHEMQRQDGELVPYLYNIKDVTQMTETRSSNARSKLMSFMMKKEILSQLSAMKKIDMNINKEDMKEERLRQIEESDIYYGLGQNTISLRHSKQNMNIANNWRAIREFHDWGVPFVIDMSFTSKYKTDRVRNKSLVLELMNAVGLNRDSKVPFQLHLTGVDDAMFSHLENEPFYQNPAFNMTQESHLDMFPHDRLVYLSPDSRNDLKKFDCNDIYVVGGIIDSIEKTPLTLSTAKKLKIRHARFPMRQVLGLQHDLNIDTCVAIMNDLKESNDWFYALRWLPSRVLFTRIRDHPNPSIEHQLMFRAHRQLSPTTPDNDEKIRNNMLGPAQYRSYYRRIMECKSKEEMNDIKAELVI